MTTIPPHIASFISVYCILIIAILVLSPQRTTGVLAMTEYVLAVHDTVDGLLPRLAPKSKAALHGHEHWQVERFHSLPRPPWLARPYLRYDIFTCLCFSHMCLPALQCSVPRNPLYAYHESASYPNFSFRHISALINSNVHYTAT